MKNLLTILGIFLSTNLLAQLTDNNLATTGGIGPFKLEMTIDKVEEILNKKIVFSNKTINENSYESDTVKCKYKDLTIEFVFIKDTYYDEVTSKMDNSKSKIKVWSLKSNSKSLSTKSGISIGDDRMKIFKTYTQYRLDYLPDWDKIKNPTKSQIILSDNETSNQLTFYLDNGIVVGFGASVYEGD